MMSAVLNHVWQSTLFAAAVSVLTLVLRRNQARIRYWLWVAASLKFLLPFSILVSAGSHLRLTNESAAAPSSFSLTVEQVGQPFGSHAVANVAPVVKRSADLAPAISLAVWACGFVGISFLWFMRWARLRAELLTASAIFLVDGVTTLNSPTLREPGVFGIWRPKLILPTGIVDLLSHAELEAILTHELCHIRNRDNLTAALHMCVEAVFWFHPLVWWMGTRLVEERERACDEEVLTLGSEAHIYAEGILKTCEFYLASPLICISGVSGSDLRKRIARIMTAKVATSLGAGKILLLGMAASASVCVPVALGVLSAHASVAQSINTSPASARFASVSIKANRSGGMREVVRFFGDRCGATNITLKSLVAMGYGVQESQVTGGPPWIDTERFDIAAQVLGAPQGKADEQRMSEMVRGLLAERFGLVLHRERTEVPIYELVVAKTGAKLHKAGRAITPADVSTDARISPHMVVNVTGSTGSELRFLAAEVSREVGRTVIDKTGLKGDFNYSLYWTPNQSEHQTSKSPKGVSIFSALEEQLGLRLQPAVERTDALLIDHSERPVLETGDLLPEIRRVPVRTRVAEKTPPTHLLIDRSQSPVLERDDLLRENPRELVQPQAVDVPHAAENTPIEGIENAVIFVAARVLSPVMPNTRDLPDGLITQPTRVEVETRINAIGLVSKAWLINFDQGTPIGAAALAAAKQWKFEPAKLHGQPVESDHTIVFEFRPKE